MDATKGPPLKDVVIDSPSPEVAHGEAGKYFAYLQPAMETWTADYNDEEFADEIISGNVLLVRVWVDQEFTALAACRVQAAKHGRELLVMCLVGDNADDWLCPLLASFDALALEAGCRTVTLEGRPGWVKKLAGEGYKTFQVTMRKTVGKSNGKSRV